MKRLLPILLIALLLAGALRAPVPVRAQYGGEALRMADVNATGCADMATRIRFEIAGLNTSADYIIRTGAYTYNRTSDTFSFHHFMEVTQHPGSTDFYFYLIIFDPTGYTWPANVNTDHTTFMPGEPFVGTPLPAPGANEQTDVFIALVNPGTGETITQLWLGDYACAGGTYSAMHREINVAAGAIFAPLPASAPSFEVQPGVGLIQVE